jgi:hypothetical protein
MLLPGGVGRVSVTGIYVATLVEPLLCAGTRNKKQIRKKKTVLMENAYLIKTDTLVKVITL